MNIGRKGRNLQLKVEVGGLDLLKDTFKSFRGDQCRI
jgi:hypothetical protein